MIDKFNIFNKTKIDTDKYIEIETHNNEKLKSKIKERLESSQRINKKSKRTNIVVSAVASITIVIIAIGVSNPSLADNIIKIIPEFETMLHKIQQSINDSDVAEYNPDYYPELEEEKKENKKNKLIATPVNVSSKSNGIKITIDKVMYDRKKIYLDMTLKTDELFRKSELRRTVTESPYGDGVKYIYIQNLEMYMNGNKLDMYSYGPGVVEFIDEHTINISYLIELDPTDSIDEADFKIDFGIAKDIDASPVKSTGAKWSFEFKIKSIDDGKHNIEINEKSGDYTLKSIDISKTYIEIKMELPFQPALGTPHNNFVIVKDDKGRELVMSVSVEGKNKMYTQINELINIGEIPKYIDIIVLKNIPVEGENTNILSEFRVDIK